MYALHDELRDGRLVLRLIQVNHYARHAHHKPQTDPQTDPQFPFNGASFKRFIGLHYPMLARSPKPPRTIIRAMIDWKE